MPPTVLLERGWAVMGLAIVYLRVSTEEQAKHGYSLADQEELCRAKAEELGHREIMVFADEGISGDLLDQRPALAKARALLRTGGVAAFVCMDPDRFSRKLGIQIHLTEEIERVGVQLSFVKFDKQNNPENNLFYHLRGAIAEYEKAKILERTVAGKRAKAKAGKPPGFLQPYGYRYILEDDTLRVVPQEADIVRRIFALAAAQERDADIARKLIDDGIPGPRQKHWYPATIRAILDREAYSGIHRSFRLDTSGKSLNPYRAAGAKVKPKKRPEEEWLPIPVPPIITREEWEAAHAWDDRRGRGRGRSNPQALLHGLCSCGLCGKSVHTTSVGAIRYYACSGRHQAGRLNRPNATEKCALRYRRAADLDALVWTQVKAWIGNPEAIAREAAQASKAAHAQAGKERAEIERLLQGLQIEQERTMTAYTRAWLTEAQVAERMKGIGNRQARLLQRLAGIEDTTKEVSPQEVRAMAALKDSLGADLDSLTLDERRHLVSLLVRGIVLSPEKTTIYATIPEAEAVWQLVAAEGRIV